MTTVPQSRIVVVDDNEGTRYAMSRVLTAAGFAVSGGASAAEALSLVAHKPDLLVLDLHLPDGLGFDVCRNIKKNPAVASTPVLMVSASLTDAQSRVQGLEGGADGYLIHPIEPAVLVATVRALLRTKHAEQSLAQLNATLEQRVAERTMLAEERAKQLETLAKELTQAEQRERKRLAHMLHDDLQQVLVAGLMQIDAVRKFTATKEGRRAVEEVEDLVRQAIDLSRRMTSDLAPPILYDGNLAETLEWLARDGKHKHGLDVTINVDHASAHLAEEVGMLVFQAVRELLLNVVKHAKVSQVAISVKPEGEGRVCITVRDEGVGFDASRLNGGGNSAGGLGLFSIRERLMLMGGSLRLQSTPGKGTTAMLMAPTTKPGAKDARVPGPQKQPLAPVAATASEKIRILIADDHRILREGLVRLIADQPDLELVGEAADGTAALSQALALQPDVAILDVMMPGMSGIEVTRALHRQCPTTVIIGLSMNEDPHVAHRMYEAGATEFFTKDGPSDQVIAAVRRHCQAT